MQGGNSVFSGRHPPGSLISSFNNGHISMGPGAGPALMCANRSHCRIQREGTIILHRRRMVSVSLIERTCTECRSCAHQSLEGSSSSFVSVFNILRISSSLLRPLFPTKANNSRTQVIKFVVEAQWNAKIRIGVAFTTYQLEGCRKIPNIFSEHRLFRYSFHALLADLLLFARLTLTVEKEIMHHR